MYIEKTFNQSTNMDVFKKNDGTTIHKWKLLKEILNCVGSKKLQIPTIARELNVPIQLIKHAVRYLCDKDKLAIQDSDKRNNFYFVPKKNECLLAEMLYPKSVINQFKIKQIVRHSLDFSKPAKFIRKTINKMQD